MGRLRASLARLGEAARWAQGPLAHERSSQIGSDNIARQADSQTDRNRLRTGAVGRTITAWVSRAVRSHLIHPVRTGAVHDRMRPLAGAAPFSAGADTVPLRL
jgi:hypothetical protein